NDIIQEEIRILLNTSILLQAIGVKYEIRPNAFAQKASYEKIKTARNKITEFESLYNIASDTTNQAWMMAKKQKQLEDKADKKRRKIIIKVRTIKHLKDKLEEKYNLYIIQIQSVSRDEKSDHPDSHFCLTSSIETINEPVSIPDHDFPLGRKMKLIPSVYLLINPNDTNDSFRTTALTHMANLISIMNSEDYDEVICIEEKIKPLWVLLVDSGPDENPKHLKNIIEYCKLFRFLDLDYLTVCTHAPERSMAPLSSKLAGIVLPIDYYGTYLNSQGKVINEELAKENFRFSREKLCDIWKCDQSHRRNIRAIYVDIHIDMFNDNEIS
ncbi:21306_t:CDS:2, partial [Gigaspora margarita]